MISDGRETKCQRRPIQSRWLAALAIITAMPAIGLTPRSESEDLPEGFQQIVPRGMIAALVDPEFVAANEAKISDKAWVMGFVMAGQAYAYDLNLLNHHEIVNHKIGNRSIAAVW